VGTRSAGWLDRSRPRLLPGEAGGERPERQAQVLHRRSFHRPYPPGPLTSVDALTTLSPQVLAQHAPPTLSTLPKSWASARLYGAVNACQRLSTDFRAQGEPRVLPRRRVVTRRQVGERGRVEQIEPPPPALLPGVPRHESERSAEPGQAPGALEPRVSPALERLEELARRHHAPDLARYSPERRDQVRRLTGLVVGLARVAQLARQMQEPLGASAA